MTADGRVRIQRSRGNLDYERAFITAIDDGAAEMGRVLIDDVRRTAEPGVLRRRGYTPGRLGKPIRGAGGVFKGFMTPANRWPIWTGKSRQGFYALVDRTRMVLRIMNRAVDARTQVPYPQYVERRGLHVRRLFIDRRRKYGKAFARGFRKAFLKVLK